MPKLYLVFAGDNHYPRGGVLDFKGRFATYQLALEYADTLKSWYDWIQIGVIDEVAFGLTLEYSWSNRPE